MKMTDSQDKPSNTLKGLNKITQFFKKKTIGFQMEAGYTGICLNFVRAT